MAYAPTREELARELAHDARLRQSLLDAVSAGRDTAMTNLHEIRFDHEHQRVAIFYELASADPVEMSIAEFVAFVQGATNCPDRNCRMCELGLR